MHTIKINLHRVSENKFTVDSDGYKFEDVVTRIDIGDDITLTLEYPLTPEDLLELKVTGRI